MAKENERKSDKLKIFMRRVDPYLKVTIMTKFLPKYVTAICG